MVGKKRKLGKVTNAKKIPTCTIGERKD
uniref:Uncharacterized protein n=1 Tax=Tetranychus urticae TaxID=32264 RepID=T1KJL3_TETUR